MNEEKNDSYLTLKSKWHSLLSYQEKMYNDKLFWDISHLFIITNSVLFILFLIVVARYFPLIDHKTIVTPLFTVGFIINMICIVIQLIWGYPKSHKEFDCKLRKTYYAFEKYKDNYLDLDLKKMKKHLSYYFKSTVITIMYYVTAFWVSGFILLLII